MTTDRCVVEPAAQGRRYLSGCLYFTQFLLSCSPGFDSRLSSGDFSGSGHTGDSKMALQWLPCQAPGVIGSALGVVGPVSVYCDWVK